MTGRLQEKKQNRKIGILTLFYRTYNYGAQLQAYALCHAVRKLGYDCEQIPFEWQRVQTEIDYGNYSIDRTAFENFYSQIPHSAEVYTPATIHRCNEKYTHFICGSDQIWGVEVSMPRYVLPLMTLSFADEEKVKIAYAGSMGSGAVSDERMRVILPGIEQMDVVAVRERSAAAFLRERTDQKIQTVLDPVFLMTRAEWDVLVGEETRSVGNVLVCYNISCSEELSDFAKRMAKARGLQIQNIGYIGGEPLGPMEFVRQIRDAACVVTDSFHGTALSILYHKEFYAFPIDRVQTVFSKNTRLFDMLDDFGLRARVVERAGDGIVTAPEFDVDWDRVEIVLAKKREQSLRFLRQSLAMEKKMDDTPIIPKNRCTGCGSCMLACERNCIQMEKDALGFSYPRIDRTHCISCNRCKQACPALAKKNNTSTLPQSYVCRSKDDNVRNISSSGGMFYELARNFISSGGVVAAARYDEAFAVRHDLCDNMESLGAFCQSKYAQSDAFRCFERVKEALERQQRMLFIGTPCQVAGLKKYLGTDHPALYCVDLICGGVTSPALLEKYIAEKKLHGRLQNISMRNKSRGYRGADGFLAFSMELTYEDRTEVIPKQEDWFLSTRFSFYRDSCFQCQTKSLHGYGDLTIGDDLGTVDDGLGKTLVLVHTSKGRQLLDFCHETVEICETDLTRHRQCNRMLEDVLMRPPQTEYMRATFADASMERLYYENREIEAFLEQERIRREFWIERIRNDIVRRIRIFQLYDLDLDECPGARERIFIYGAGWLGRELLGCKSQHIKGMIDRAGWMRRCGEYAVYAPDSGELAAQIRDGSDCTIIVTPVWEWLEIKEQLLSRFPEVQVLSVQKMLKDIH